MHKKLEELSLLKDNWDSYGAVPITEFALHKADLLIKALAAIQAVEPWIGPCNNGGIQLEWHRNGYDLEIEISPNEDEDNNSNVFCVESNEKSNS